MHRGNSDAEQQEPHHPQAPRCVHELRPRLSSAMKYVDRAGSAARVRAAGAGAPPPAGAPGLGCTRVGRISYGGSSEEGQLVQWHAGRLHWLLQELAGNQGGQTGRRSSWPVATSMSAAGRFCIGCNARFEGKRCRLYHPEYMYDYQEKPPEELSDGGAPGSGDDANAIAAAILAEAAAEMEGGATSGHGWSASPVAARAPSAEPTTTLAAAAAPLTSVAQLKKDGTVAFRNEDYATAAERYAAAAALEPTERSHPSNASLALLRMGRHADALASAERCCELAPDWHKGYYRRGCAQQALGQNAAARSSFMKAQQCDPNDKTVRDALVELGPAPEPAPQPEPAEEPERQAESEPAPEPELRPESDPDPEEHLDRNGSATAETGLDELEGPAATPYNGFFAGVISTRNRGRCVVARRDLAVGEVAWQFKPWAAVSSDEFLAATCAFCFRDACATSSSSGTDGPAVYTVRCEQCEIYHYCSEECKRAASPLHSLECRPALQVKRMTSSGGIRRDSTATRLLIRILARRRLEIQRSNSSRMFEPDEPVEIQGLSGAPQHNGKLGTVLRFDQKRGRYLVRLEEGSKGSGEGDCTNAQGDGKPLGLKPANLLRRKLSQQTTGPIWCDATFSHIQKLQSHVTELPPARIESMRTVVKGLLSIPGLNGGGEASEALTEDGMLQLLGAVQCNSQGIVDLEHHQRLGTHAIKRGELLSAPYDINHSCDPNTWVSITGDCVQFRCVS